MFMYCFMYVYNAVILLQSKDRSSERSVSINFQDESAEYVSGHVDGRNLFPAAGYLVSSMKLFHPKRDTLSL
jgi:hypothetical protein